jgi:hypothetical protein
MTLKIAEYLTDEQKRTLMEHTLLTIVYRESATTSGGISRRLIRRVDRDRALEHPAYMPPFIAAHGGCLLGVLMDPDEFLGIPTSEEVRDHLNVQRGAGTPEDFMNAINEAINAWDGGKIQTRAQLAEAIGFETIQSHLS